MLNRINVLIILKTLFFLFLLIYIIINSRDELKKEIKKEEIEFTVDPIVINDSKIIEDLNIINNNISQNEIEEIINRIKKEKEDIERYTIKDNMVEINKQIQCFRGLQDTDTEEAVVEQIERTN